MIRWILHRVIDRATSRYDYNATYMHEMLETSPGAFIRFMLAQGVNLHRQGISLEAWTAARLVAIQREDCGPCAQLVVNMARVSGVRPAILRAIIARDWTNLPEPVALTMRFTDAVLAHEPCDELRDQLRDLFGERGIVSLALAISQTRTYPAIKRVLGHAQSCERLQVEGQYIPVAKAA